MHRGLSPTTSCCRKISNGCTSSCLRRKTSPKSPTISENWSRRNGRSWCISCRRRRRSPVYLFPQGTHKPTRVDNGIADPKITREWIEQIILSRVQPRIQKLSITRIALDTAQPRFAYVLAVEPTTTGSHQAPDKKYYRTIDTAGPRTSDPRS